MGHFLSSAGHLLAYKCSTQWGGEPKAQMCVDILYDTSWASAQVALQLLISTLYCLFNGSQKIKSCKSHPC